MDSDDAKLISGDIDCIKTMSDKLRGHFNKSDAHAIKKDLKEIIRCVKEIDQITNSYSIPCYMSTEEALTLGREIQAKRIIPYGG